MNIYLSKEFIRLASNLLKVKAHSDIEKILIESLFNKSLRDIKTGIARLKGNINDSFFLKKRIAQKGKGKSSGYRLYAWLIVVDNNLYLLYIHPKTGKYAQINISKPKQSELIETFQQTNTNNEFIKVCLFENKIIDCKTKTQIFK